MGKPPRRMSASRLPVSPERPERMRSDNARSARSLASWRECVRARVTANFCAQLVRPPRIRICLVRIARRLRREGEATPEDAIYEHEAGHTCARCRNVGLSPDSARHKRKRRGEEPLFARDPNRAGPRVGVSSLREKRIFFLSLSQRTRMTRVINFGAE